MVLLWNISFNDFIAVIICSALYAPVYVTYIYDYNLIIMNVKLKLINYECEKKKKNCIIENVFFRS